VEASCAGIGRAEKNPSKLAGIGEIQPIKTSWRTNVGAQLVRAKNTKRASNWRIGQGRRNSARLTHKAFRQSDNNIVPEKQANKGSMSPWRSLWREGR
jgi:hypothetical protein